MIEVNISAEPLNVQDCIGKVIAPDCGGIDIFIGTVRNATKGNTVIRLEFEAYERMALKEMQKLANQAIEKWAVKNILIHHRVGALEVGDIPVIICISAAHRGAAFDACRYIIDTLKQTVPIWKKEIFENGEVWVAAHP